MTDQTAEINSDQFHPNNKTYLKYLVAVSLITIVLGLIVTLIGAIYLREDKDYQKYWTYTILIIALIGAAVNSISLWIKNIWFSFKIKDQIICIKNNYKVFSFPLNLLDVIYTQQDYLQNKFGLSRLIIMTKKGVIPFFQQEAPEIGDIIYRKEITSMVIFPLLREKESSQLLEILKRNAPSDTNIVKS